MKKKFTRVLLIIGVLALLPLVGMYRSYVDKIPFITAFDKMVTALFGGIWTLLQITTLQIALLILVAAYISRNYLKTFLPRVQKVSAAGVGIEFSSLITGFEQHSPVELGRTALEKSELLPIVVNNLPDAVCWFLIKINHKPVSFQEATNILMSEIMTEADIVGHISDDPKNYIGLGTFSGINVSLRNIVFTYDNKPIKTINDAVGLQLYPEALDLIKKKLKIE